MTAELASLVSRVTSMTSEIVAEDRASAVADEEIAELLYAAARLFSAKTDRVGKISWPIREDALTATETVVLVTALLDAADVNLFDMAIWYRRAE